MTPPKVPTTIAECEKGNPFGRGMTHKQWKRLKKKSEKRFRQAQEKLARLQWKVRQAEAELKAAEDMFEMVKKQ